MCGLPDRHFHNLRALKSDLLTYLKLVTLLSLRLENCERSGRVVPHLKCDRWEIRI